MFLYTSVLVFSSLIFFSWEGFFLWERFFPWVHWPCTLNKFWCHWLSFRLAHPNPLFAIYLVLSIRPVVYVILLHAYIAFYCCIVLAPVIHTLPAPSCCLAQAYRLSVVVCMLYLKWEDVTYIEVSLLQNRCTAQMTPHSTAVSSAIVITPHTTPIVVAWWFPRVDVGKEVMVKYIIWTSIHMNAGWTQTKHGE